MKTQEIKDAIDSGKRVYVDNPAYEVIKDSRGQYLIKCTHNDYCIGLTWADGETLNDLEDSFYIA